jgi:hypothetical protein
MEGLTDSAGQREHEGMSLSFTDRRALEDLDREASALHKQIAARMPVHPGEIYDLVRRYLDMGEHFRAQRLADHLPDEEDWR